LARPPRVIALVTAASIAALATGASASSRHAGPLAGTWSGYISGSHVKRQHIVITVNAGERGGSWKLSNTCYGTETLDSISGGYHHYRRHVAHGASCAGGDIDCLKRAGADVYDAVTSHLGGEYSQGGTLHRVRAR